VHLLLPIVLLYAQFIQHSATARTDAEHIGRAGIPGRADLPPKPDRVCKRFKFYVRKANLPERYSHLSPEVLGKAMEETFGRS